MSKMDEIKLAPTVKQTEISESPTSGLPPASLCNTIKAKFLRTKTKLISAGVNVVDSKNRNEYESLNSSCNWLDNNLSATSTDSSRLNIYQNDEHQAGEIDLENLIHIREVQSTAQNISDINGSTHQCRHLLLCSYILVYMTYLVFGSFCFQAIESPLERNIRISIQNTKITFLRKYPQVSDNDLEEFLEAVIKANDRGISPLRNATNEMNWGFGQALFFSSTIVTTIGYGHVTPLSQTGKIFCMLYATFGIPLTLVLLSAVVERLLIPANWLLGCLNSKLGHLYQPFNIRLLHLSMIVLLVAGLFLAIPTTIFAYLEPEWDALDAFYYCFISLTTIGLGDYIPGDGVSIENRSLYKMCITGYLICGLIAIMFVLTVFYDIPQLNLGQLFTENVNGETEKLRLSGNSATCYSGTSGLYMPQGDDEIRRAVVRIRPHGDESPSPDDPPSSSVLHSDMRIP